MNIYLKCKYKKREKKYPHHVNTAREPGKVHERVKKAKNGFICNNLEN